MNLVHWLPIIVFGGPAFAGVFIFARVQFRKTISRKQSVEETCLPMGGATRAADFAHRIEEVRRANCRDDPA